MSADRPPSDRPPSDRPPSDGPPSDGPPSDGPPSDGAYDLSGVAPLGPLAKVVARVKCALALLAFGLLTPFFLPVMWAFGRVRRHRVKVSALYGRLTAWASLWIFGIRLDVHGAERLAPAMPAIYVSNHSSFLDAFTALALEQFGTIGIAKAELRKMPFFGLFFDLGGHLLIERTDRSKARTGMEGVARAVLEHGFGVWIYPEGTLPREGALLPFKKGFVNLAVETGLPVVPLVCHDAVKVWPTRTLDVRPGTVHFDVLEPISTEGWSHDTAAAHAAEVRDRFVAALAAGPAPRGARVPFAPRAVASRAE